MKSHVVKALFICTLLSWCTVSIAAKPSLVITERGIGPINIDTPFDIKAIKKLLPRLKVSAAVWGTDGDDIPLIHVADQHGLLFVIAPHDDHKRIFSICTATNRALDGTLTPTIGRSYQRIYGDQVATCFPGMEQESGTVLCDATGSRHLVYQFGDSPPYDMYSMRSDADLPELSILKKYVVKRVVWRSRVEEEANGDRN